MSSCRYSGHPFLFVLAIKMQQHAQHWNQLSLMPFVLLLQELQQHVLEVDVVDRALTQPRSCGTSGGCLTSTRRGG